MKRVVTEQWIARRGYSAGQRKRGGVMAEIFGDTGRQPPFVGVGELDPSEIDIDKPANFSITGEMLTISVVGRSDLPCESAYVLVHLSILETAELKKLLMSAL